MLLTYFVSTIIKMYLSINVKAGLIGLGANSGANYQLFSLGLQLMITLIVGYFSLLIDSLVCKN